AAGGGRWMCKHIAATLYGLGRRLDDDPALLFTLRRSDPNELVEHASKDLARTKASTRYKQLDDSTDLEKRFGITIAEPRAVYRKTRKRARAKIRRGRATRH